MILKALYDYYHRSDDLPIPGMEEKEIGFLLVITKEGKFIRLEDCRIDNSHAKIYLVKKHVSRTSAVAPNHLYDNAAYVLGYCDVTKIKKEVDKEKEELKTVNCLEAFKEKVRSAAAACPESAALQAVLLFYEHSREQLLEWLEKDPLWEDVKKNLSKKYSTFSFRLEGEKKIIAEQKALLQLDSEEDVEGDQALCLITGKRGTLVDTTSSTMIPGSQATAKLVAFQVNSGYDSYGKTKCGNAPITKEAEFAYTTALNALLKSGSRNKFMLGNRTFVFWASSQTEASKQAEESLFDLLGFSEEAKDDPDANVLKVRKVFESIYSGTLKVDMDDRFYILGLAPNVARIAVVYWSETSLKEFAEKILAHFEDMEIGDTRKNTKPYQGIREMISNVTLGGKLSDATPNLPESVVQSVFQGLPYPFTLYSSCIRRIRAEQKLTITRVAIIKAYLNRLNNPNSIKINTMLDKKNTNQGYLCGRLFAVLDKIQEEANSQNSIRDRYQNAASTTPSAVFATILNLSNHHLEKLSEGRKIFFEKLKQEIFSQLSAHGFPAHLDLQDQGRFFVGYYHQRQDFFTSKKEQE
ncbi:MAG: type I-C CRISPR-associated protein Cas8c/Csd1 [Bacteroides sp.]|mgnify:FL=1|nr:type I-C CRISPR-associated protein Cas8c/Csd1 [Bacteroides sp.]